MPDGAREEPEGAQEPALAKAGDKVRSKTIRSRGDSLERIIGDLNPLLRGWFGYFQHATPALFGVLDGFVRRRLRAILRSRKSAPALGGAKPTINAGPMPFSRLMGCSPFTQPSSRPDTPDEETNDWRAVCGRTARTVRRAGRANTLPDPYRLRAVARYANLCS
jgi:group II intron maturase